MSFVLVSFFVTADFYRKKNMNVKDTVKINFENSKKTFKSKYRNPNIIICIKKSKQSVQMIQ